MKKSLFLMLTALCITTSLAACSDEDNDSPSCNAASFTGNCIDSMHYSACIDGHVKTMACETGNVCGMGVNGQPACLSSSPAGGVCQTPYAKQCNGYYVQTCINGIWTNDPAPCEAGCQDGVCISVPQPAQCSEQTPCTDPNKDCVSGVCVDKTVTPECSDQNPCADPNKDCVNGVCVDKTNTQECSDQNPCTDPNKTCVYGTCKAMDACQTNADCKEFNMLCRDSKCQFAPNIQCTQNSDCGSGFICDIQKCLANDACSLTHTCPDKQICHNGHCQNTPHEACSIENPCADKSKTCIQGQCIACSCSSSDQTCDLNGNCVSTTHSNIKNVTVGDVCEFNPNWSFCDGNVLFSCSSSVGEDTAKVNARDCGASICTNSLTEDLNCHEACSVKGDFYGECLKQYYEITNSFVYMAFKTECTESEDGRLIWTYTEGYETCKAGCTNGSCDPVPVEFGQTCQVGTYADKCIDQWAMTCEKSQNAAQGSIWGEDCAHYSDDSKAYTCAVSADTKVSGCVLPCTQEGSTTSVCHKYPTYPNIYSETLKCSRTADGGLGYFLSNYDECANGCDNNTGLCK